MDITILNGNNDETDSKFENYLAQYTENLKRKGNTLTVFTLRDMEIQFCTGCWTCWWRTPGQCIFKDEMKKIYQNLIKSNLCIFVSPIIMGYTSTVIKKTMDRLIPLLNCHMEIVKGELHHRKRYENYPLLGVLVEKEAETDSEDLEILKDLYYRFSINFRNDLVFFGTTEKSPEEAANETCSI